VESQDLDNEALERGSLSSVRIPLVAFVTGARSPGAAWRQTPRMRGLERRQRCALGAT
jgi:hypothetical protein